MLTGLRRTFDEMRRNYILLKKARLSSAKKGVQIPTRQPEGGGGILGYQSIGNKRTDPVYNIVLSEDYQNYYKYKKYKRILIETLHILAETLY